jgi:hypothetical protein
MILQLDPTLPLETPKGRGFAHFLIDYGTEHHLLWVVFLDATGECWTFPNPEIRLQSNPTMGVRNASQVESTAKVGVCREGCEVGAKTPL